jgi:hypothetical protein
MTIESDSPLDQAGNIVSQEFLNHYKSESQEIGGQILGITGGIRNTLQLGRIVSEGADRHHISEVIESLAQLLEQQHYQTGSSFILDDDLIGADAMFYSHHQEVAWNLSLKYPKNMVKESRKILKEALADPLTSDLRKDEIRCTFDYVEFWNIFNLSKRLYKDIKELFGS